jgi:flagellar M-ring protein FliF
VQGLTSNQTSEKYEKNTGTTNYEVGKTVSSVKSQFARIKRITAAVIVDGKYKYKQDEGGEDTDELEYEALSKSDLEALVALVSRSIGINENRGDLITVKNLQFKRTVDNIDEDKITQLLKLTQAYLSPFSALFKYMFVLILLLILYIKVIAPFSERMLEVSKDEDDLYKPHLDIEDDEGEDLIDKVQKMRKKVEEQLGVGDSFNEDELKYEVLLEKIQTMADDSAEDFAALLEALLSDEQEV